MKNLITRFQNDESGATAIEYGLIAGLLSVAIIGILITTSGSLVDVWETIDAALVRAVTGV